LKRKLHIHDARNAGQKAAGQWIELLAIDGVLLLLRRGPRLVRNLAAFDDAPARRHAVLCSVILKVVPGSISRLPDALQIRFAVWSAGQRLSIRRRGRQYQDKEEQSQTHREIRA